MVNVNELKAAIVRKGMTQEQVAIAIGITPRTFTSRLKKGFFGSDEIEAMMMLLEINDPIPIFLIVRYLLRIPNALKKKRETAIRKEETNMSDEKILINVSEDGEFQAEFETLEINRKNKTFKINGIDFGKGCSTFSLTADYEGIVVCMEKRITFTSKA